MFKLFLCIFKTCLAGVGVLMLPNLEQIYHKGREDRESISYLYTVHCTEFSAFNPWREKELSTNPLTKHRCRCAGNWVFL
jgi:hypothetical protein